MMFKNHMTMGAASGAYVAMAGYATNAIDPYQGAILFLSGIFGSLLPDIDHPQSKAGKLFLPISFIISKVFGHRTVTHSIIGIMILATGFYFLDAKYIATNMPWAFVSGYSVSLITIGIAVGYASHILGDMLTESGVPLFWPAPARIKIPLFAIKTGGFMETIYAMAFVALLAYMAWNNGYLTPYIQ